MSWKKSLSAVISTVNTTTWWTYSKSTATHPKRIPICLTATLLTEVPSQWKWSCWCWLGRFASHNTFSWVVATMRQSNSIKCTASKARSKPSTMWRHTTYSLSFSATCPLPTASTRKLWCVMAAFTPKTVSNSETSKRSTGRESLAMKASWLSHYGLIPAIYQADTLRSVVSEWCLGPMSLKDSSMTTILVSTQSMNVFVWETWPNHLLCIFIAMLVRSHEVKPEGYEYQKGGKVLTIFSAPNYCDQMGNKGAYVRF